MVAVRQSIQNDGIWRFPGAHRGELKLAGTRNIQPAVSADGG
jgi:hypothetical protein